MKEATHRGSLSQEQVFGRSVALRQSVDVVDRVVIGAIPEQRAGGIAAGSSVGGMKSREVREVEPSAAHGAEFVGVQFVNIVFHVHLLPCLGRAIPSQLVVAGVRGAVRLRCDLRHSSKQAGRETDIVRPARNDAKHATCRLIVLQQGAG
jgi:hypothetical protein